MRDSHPLAVSFSLAMPDLSAVKRYVAHPLCGIRARTAHDPKVEWQTPRRCTFIILNFNLIFILTYSAVAVDKMMMLLIKLW